MAMTHSIQIRSPMTHPTFDTDSSLTTTGRSQTHKSLLSKRAKPRPARTCNSLPPKAASARFPSPNRRAAPHACDPPSERLRAQNKHRNVATDATPSELAAEAAASAYSEESKSNPPQKHGPKADKNAVMQTDARVIVGTYARAPVVFVSGNGSKLYDTEGREYIDMAGGIAVNALGHCDPGWVRALTTQANLLAHVSNLYYTVPQVDLARRLVDSSFADKVFYTNSGTEANEAAIKFARKFQRVRAGAGGKEGWFGSGFGFGTVRPATEFVAFSACFHGRTVGALSLTSKEAYRAPFEPLMPGVKFAAYGDLASAVDAIVRGRTAAVFVEPVQGEGGVNVATEQFLRGLRKLCDDANALLIFDEIQCGLGRTGKLWAHEAYGVVPDIMTLAKPLAGGLPIGAVLVTDDVASAISPGDHGSTFAGNPLVCQVALSVMDRLQEPGFLENVASKGDRLRKLLALKLGSKPHVKQIRGCGLLNGIQLDVPAGPFIDAARDRGLVVISAGKGDVIRMVPPLVITDEEISQAVDILASCFDA